MTERITDDLEKRDVERRKCGDDLPFTIYEMVRDARAHVRELEGAHDKALTANRKFLDTNIALIAELIKLRDAVREFEAFTSLPYRTDGVDKCVTDWWGKVKKLTEGDNKDVPK